MTELAINTKINDAEIQTSFTRFFLLNSFIQRLATPAPATGMLKFTIESATKNTPNSNMEEFVEINMSVIKNIIKFK